MMPKFPFLTAQQFNLDWVMQTLKKILAFMPIDKGAIGDVLQRKASGAAWEPIAAVSLDIHGLNTAEAVADDDEIPLYDKTATGNRKATVAAILARVTHPVTSVNGKTGAVVLDAADVGALPDDYTPPVTSVNGQTGAVVLDAADVGAAEPNDSGSGYCKMADGTLIQWGTTRIESGSTNVYESPINLALVSIQFPISFASTNYIVFGSGRYSTGAAIAVGQTGETRTSCSLHWWDVVARTFSASIPLIVKWCAIGRWK